MAATIGFMLRNGSRACLEVSPPRKAPGYFIKNFFTSANNRCSSYVKKTSAVDKIVKVAAASSDLAKAVAERTSAGTEVLGRIKVAQEAFSGARMVVGLFNVFNGCIPSIYDAAKNSIVFGSALRLGQESVYLGDKQAGDHQTNSIRVPYNQMYLGRKEQALGLGIQICKGVAASTYGVGFGALRSALFANKIGGFMAPQVKADIGYSFNILMCANHAAAFTGGVLSLVHERMAYQRARSSCLLEIQSFVDKYNETRAWNSSMVLKNLDTAYRSSVVGHILVLIEKIFELVLDCIKLIPALISLVPAEAKAVLGLLAGMIGVYKIWRVS